MQKDWSEFLVSRTKGRHIAYGQQIDKPYEKLYFSSKLLSFFNHIYTNPNPNNGVPDVKYTYLLCFLWLAILIIGCKHMKKVNEINELTLFYEFYSSLVKIYIEKKCMRFSKKDHSSYSFKSFQRCSIVNR